MGTPKVRVLVKPLLKPWLPWRYVTDSWSVLTDDPEKAAVFQDNGLYKVQDYYIFSRKDYELVSVHQNRGAKHD